MKENNNTIISTSFFKRFVSKNAVTLYIVILFFVLYTVGIYSNSISRQMLNMLVTLSCYMLLAVSLNLVVGFLGELSLGHAAFMSVGAYSGCILSVTLVNQMPEMEMWIRLPLSMLFGGLMAAIFGIIVGIPALRLDGDYLAIVTLAFGEIVKNIITNLEDFTGGARGYDTIDIYSKPKILLPYAAVAVFISVVLIMNLVKSKHGRAITAVRDNKIAANSTGVNATYFKLIVFAFAAFIAGVAGVLWGHSVSIIKASAFDFNMSIEILVIVVLGGMGSIRGSIIAAIVLKLLPEMLRNLNEDLVKYRMLIYSVLLILLMLFNSSPALVSWRERLNIKNLFKKKKSKVSQKKEEVSDDE